MSPEGMFACSPASVYGEWVMRTALGVRRCCRSRQEILMMSAVGRHVWMHAEVERFATDVRTCVTPPTLNRVCCGVQKQNHGQQLA